MEVRLRQLLLDFCLANLRQISCQNLGRMARLINLNFSRDHLPTGLRLQQRLQEQAVVERLAPNTLGRFFRPRYRNSHLKNESGTTFEINVFMLPQVVKFKFS